MESFVGVLDLEVFGQDYFTNHNSGPSAIRSCVRSARRGESDCCRCNSILVYSPPISITILVQIYQCSCLSCYTKLFLSVGPPSQLSTDHKTCELLILRLVMHGSINKPFFFD